MFRTITFLFLSFCCLFAGGNLHANDGVLLAQFDYCAGHGMELLYNDVNSDLLLLYVFTEYKNNTVEVLKTSLRIIHLQRGEGGTYAAAATERTVFETARQIQQLDWTYDSTSQKYMIALLNGEIYSDERDIKLVQLDLEGVRVGNVKTLASGNFVVNYPLICAVPKGTVNAPMQARFLFVGRGWIPMGQSGNNTGIVSVFLNSNGNALGQLEYSVKEVAKDNKRPTHEPIDLAPSGDKKGFLLACERRENSSSDFLPTLVRLNGNAKYVKHLTVGDSEPSFASLRIQQVSRKKFAFAWVDKATKRYWNVIVPANLKKAKTKKLVSEQPACTSEYDEPYTIFCKPEGAKKTTVFFAGDKSDMTVYTVLMKKNGKTSDIKPVALWDSTGLVGQYAFDYWFVTAPVKGTSDIYCAVVLRGEDKLYVYGYAIGGN